MSGFHCKIFHAPDLIPAAWAGLPGPVRIFNPSLLRSAAGWLFAYRVVGEDQARRIGLCRLDDELNVVPGSTVPLSDGISLPDDGSYSQRTRTWFADPRLFAPGNRSTSPGTAAGPRTTRKMPSSCSSSTA